MDRSNFERFKGLNAESCDRRLYIGNIDQRISEAAVIKMFSPFGKIICEDFLWHTRGPQRGKPRGYAFIQYSTKEEAQLAKVKMDGKLASGRPLVVLFAGEKYLAGSVNSVKAEPDGKKSTSGAGTSGQISRSAKITAIKNKLKSLEEEGFGIKKPRLPDDNSTEGCE